MSSDPHRPRVMRGAPRGARRSVDRGTHRPAIEPRKSAPGCRRLRDGGRRYGRGRQREPPSDPARSETLAWAHAPCTGTGRSPRWPQATAVWSASGRREPKPMMHGREKSDRAIVAGKPAKAAVAAAAEPVEPRARAKGNAGQTDTPRTPSRASVSP